MNALDPAMLDPFAFCVAEQQVHLGLRVFGRAMAGGEGRVLCDERCRTIAAIFEPGIVEAGDGVVLSKRQIAKNEATDARQDSDQKNSIRLFH